MLPRLPADRLVEMFRSMLVIRRFEEGLIRLAERHDVGHFHVYIGQEVTGMVALSFMKVGDMAFTTHRNHGHLLARAADPGRMYAEILGKATGYNGGKGGTLHIASADLGFPVTSASTGGCIPLATGAGFAFRERDIDRVSVCLTGDGSLEEGAWHESVNIAALRSLPLIFLIENNSLEALGQIANEYPSSTLATPWLTDLAKPFGVPAVSIDGGDAAAVHETMGEAVARARGGEGPSFIEARTVRWPGSRPLWPQLLTGETDLRTAWDESTIPVNHAEWHRSQDGLLRFLRELLGVDGISPERALEMDGEVRARIDHAIRFALDSPYPPAEAALADVFA